MTEATMRRPGVGVGLLLVLALLASVAPFSTDLYLSAFPLMATDLHTSATAVQLTLTSFLVGLAAGQLVFGPVSDRVGRRGPLLVGSAVFVFASIAAVLAPSIEFLVAARLVQGLSGAAGMVLGRAVIADREQGAAASRAFSLMMIVGGVAPVIAPLVGSLLVDAVGWRGVLAVLAVLAVAMLLGSWLVVAESHTAERRGAGGGVSARELGTRAYLAPAISFVFGFSVMMAYISASPFLYQEVIGLGAVGYGAMFAVNAAGLVAVSALATRLLRRIPPRRVLSFGIMGLVLATCASLVLSIAGAPAFWLAIPIFVAVSSLGFVMGSATGLALGAVPRAAGTASAVLGAAQFGMAAVASPLVSLGGSESTLALSVVMVACALIAGAGFLAIPRTAVDDGARPGHSRGVRGGSTRRAPVASKAAARRSSAVSS